MTPTRLGPPMHEEHGYRVREVFVAFGNRERSEGFAFEGPGFNALIIYPTVFEAQAALQALVDTCSGA